MARRVKRVETFGKSRYFLTSESLRMRYNKRDAEQVCKQVRKTGGRCRITAIVDFQGKRWLVYVKQVPLMFKRRKLGKRRR